MLVTVKPIQIAQDIERPAARQHWQQLQRPAVNNYKKPVKLIRSIV